MRSSPPEFDDTARSLAAGERVGNAPGSALASATPCWRPMPGELTFAINSRLLAGGLAVTDDEVATAMRLAFRHLKLVVEPGGAVALAAALAGRLPTRGRTIGVVVSGGNVDAELFAQVLAGPEPAITLSHGRGRTPRCGHLPAARHDNARPGSARGGISASPLT